MPVPNASVVWWGSLLWLMAVGGAAFVIAWLSGTRLHIHKLAYVVLLLGVTVGLSASYVAWLGVDYADILATHWGWGVLGGVIAATLLALPASHQPVDHPLHGRDRTVALASEGVVYGTAEGILLSALPAFIGWQMVHSLAWSGAVGGVARWTVPFIAAAYVVIAHHLGYWNFRNRILVPVTLGLTVQTAAFLITTSWIAPALAHVLLHSELVVRGSEMPPQDRPARAMGQQQPLRAA